MKSGPHQHRCRWSGWPGAWCLDCGREDSREIALADGNIDENGIVQVEEGYCTEPGSNRYNPYFQGNDGGKG